MKNPKRFILVFSAFTIVQLLVPLAPACANHTLVVILKPLSTPSEVDCGLRQDLPSPMQADQVPGQYVADVAPPSGRDWVARYVVSGVWPDGERQLYLRITPLTKLPLRTLLDYEDAAADNDTLNAVDTRAADFYSLVRKYFLSRDVYRALQQTDSSVKNRAFRLWFDAAFDLAQQFPMIDMDPEVIDLAQNTREAYYRNMLAKTVAFEWRDIGNVADLIAEKKFSQADRMLRYYKSLYSNLSAAQQKVVKLIAHVDDNVLDGELKLLSSKTS